MGVILGTVPGWERDNDWSSDNRTYIAPGYIKYDIPEERIPKERRHEYRIIVNITLYLYDSPCSICNIAIIRRINNIKIIGIYEAEYPGGLEAWGNDFSNDEANELIDRSNEEIGGLLDCYGCERLTINITEREYIPPLIKCPEFVKDTIRGLEERIKITTGVTRERLQKTIDNMKKKYNCP